MESIPLEIGVGGTFAILVVKIVLDFVRDNKSKTPASGQSALPPSSNGYVRASTCDAKHEGLANLIKSQGDNINKQFDALWKRLDDIHESRR